MSHCSLFSGCRLQIMQSPQAAANCQATACRLKCWNPGQTSGEKLKVLCDLLTHSPLHMIHTPPGDLKLQSSETCVTVKTFFQTK